MRKRKEPITEDQCRNRTLRVFAKVMGLKKPNAETEALYDRMMEEAAQAEKNLKELNLPEYDCEFLNNTGIGENIPGMDISISDLDMYIPELDINIPEIDFDLLSGKSKID